MLMIPTGYISSFTTGTFLKPPTYILFKAYPKGFFGHAYSGLGVINSSIVVS